LYELHKLEVEGNETDWTSGEGVQAGDRQLFCISTDLKDAEDLQDDPWRDAAHSIWKALGPMHSVPGNMFWPRQAPFQLLVRFNEPVPKADFIAADILKVPRWPQGCKGKLLCSEAQIKGLANVLSRRNPKQRRMIAAALGL
jgi:lambda repressor-like predicted transcriptional regulator